MREVRTEGGITLSVQALEHGFFRIRSGGYDGYPASLLERYGFVYPLEPDSSCREEGLEITSPDGRSVTIDDRLGFEVRNRNGVLVRSLESTRVATFPTMHGNAGYQLDLPIAPGEKFIGFGDFQRDRFLLNGMRNTLWIEYPVKHVPVPFIMSNRGYGVFFNTTRKLHFDIGATDPRRARFSVEHDFLDVYIVTGGSYRELIRAYCELTGFPKLPPLKSFGLWLIMHTRATGHDVLVVAKTLRDAGIPCDNISLEPDWMQNRYDYSTDKEWSAEKFRGTPDGSWFRAGPNRMINALNRMGFELGLWLCVRYDFSREEERRLVSDGAPVDTSVGSSATGSTASNPVSRAGVDAYIPEIEGLVEEDEAEKTGHAPVLMDTNTRDEPWFEHLQRFVDDGVRFFKVDPALLINEFPDRLYANGLHDDQMHNIAFLLSSKQMSLDYEAYTGRRSYGIAVAGWAGLQRFPGTWAGDTGGGAGPMVGILQDALVGHSYATCDMQTSDVTGLHMGFLLPWALINSWASFHYPGFQGAEMDDAYRDYSRLRMSLLLYLYGLAYRAFTTGEAIVSPLLLEWPDVDAAYEVTDEFMLGDAFLVSVYRKDVVLPEGRWFDFWTGDIIHGTWEPIDVAIPEGRGGHLMVREGAVVPMVEPRDFVTADPVDAVTWTIFPGTEPSRFTLYLDDGDGLAYREGAFVAVTLVVEPDASGLSLSWSKPEGDLAEAVDRIEHRFEILGRTDARRIVVTAPDGVERGVEWGVDIEGNRIGFSTCVVGECVRIEY